MDTWVLVADRSRARIHAWTKGEAPRIISQIDHPSGRKHDRDFNTDRPGRAFDRAADGRHALGWEEPPAEHHAHVFARELAAMLRHAREENRFRDLVLVAEPKFLGAIRDALDEITRKHVVGEIAKELSAPGGGALEEHLERAWLDRPSS